MAIALQLKNEGNELTVQSEEVRRSSGEIMRSNRGGRSPPVQRSGESRQNQQIADAQVDLGEQGR